MKKIIFLCAVLFLIPAQSVAQKVKGKPSDAAILDLEANYVLPNEISEDGNLSEWSAAKHQAFSTIISGEHEYDWTGPKDLSAEVMAAYTHDKIVFALKIKDNVVAVKGKKGDGVEIRFSDGLGKNTGIRIDLAPLAKNEKPKASWLQKVGKIDNDVLLVDGYATGDGYEIEVSVPFAGIAKDNPVMQGKIGYCVLVRDRDFDDPNEDEVAIASCPIRPNKTQSLKYDEMGKIAFDYKSVLRAQVAEDAQRALSGVCKNCEIKAEALGDVTGDSTKELLLLIHNALFVAGVDTNGKEPSWSWNLMPLSVNTNIVSLESKALMPGAKESIILNIEDKCKEHQAVGKFSFYIAVRDKKVTEPLLILQREQSDGSNTWRNTVSVKKNDIVLSADPESAESEAFNACDIDMDPAPQPMIMVGGKNALFNMIEFGFPQK